MEFELLFPVPVLSLGLAMGITLLAASVQATLGFGFALISVPVCALIAPDLAPIPQLFVMLPLNLMTAFRERTSMRPKEVAFVLAGRLPGAAIGFVLLAFASARSLDFMLAGIVLLAVILLASRGKLPFNPATQAAAGTVSGTMELVSSMGGPPLALLYRDARGSQLRANLAFIFSVGGTITILTRILADSVFVKHLVIAVWLMPEVLLGFYLSRFFIHRVEGRPLRIGVLTFVTISAIVLGTRAFLAG